MKRSYYTKLSGTSFRQDTIAKLNTKTQLRVVARPDNEYDEYAVEVQALLSDGWEQVGWIPKGSNKDLSEWLQAGESADITLSDVTGGSQNAPTLGVNVGITFGDADDVDLSKMSKVKVVYGDDPYIYFDEAEHRAYDVHGKLLLSGSQLEDKYHDSSSLKYPAKAISKRTGIPVEDIMSLWDSKGEIAASYGTVIHRAMELAHEYKDIIENIDKNMEQSEEWSRLAPNNIADIITKYFKYRNKTLPLKGDVETEVRVKYKRYTGIVDNLEWDGDNFHIYDYKCTPQIKMVKYGELKAKKYTLQQNLYRYIIEKSTGKHCTGMTLMVYDGDNWKHEDLESVDIENFIK